MSLRHQGTCCNLRIGVKYEISLFFEPQGTPCCNLRIGVKYEVWHICDFTRHNVATYA